MRIESVTQHFNPVKVKITFESESELDALATLLNTTCVTEGIEKVFGGKTADELRCIRQHLKGCGANTESKTTALYDAIKATKP